MKPGEKLFVCDGEGTDYTCRLLGKSGGAIEAEILSRNTSCAGRHIRCGVFTAFSKGDGMENVIMKAVEPGPMR